MAVFNVSYDLYRGEQSDYRKLSSALESFPNWYHALESTWFVVADLTAKELIHFLRPYIDPPDKMIVTPIELDGGWWTNGIEAEGLQWLKGQLSPSSVA